MAQSRFQTTEREEATHTKATIISTYCDDVLLRSKLIATITDFQGCSLFRLINLLHFQMHFEKHSLCQPHTREDLLTLAKKIR